MGRKVDGSKDGNEWEMFERGGKGPALPWAWTELEASRRPMDMVADLKEQEQGMDHDDVQG